MPDSAINFYAYWPLIGLISSNQEVPDIVTGHLDLIKSAISRKFGQVSQDPCDMNHRNGYSKRYFKILRYVYLISVFIM